MLKVKCAYYAFGNCSITQGLSETIANLNPSRYRGYFYDTDYLSTEDVSGLKGYVYCNNNPVYYNDSSAHSSIVRRLICFDVGFLTTSEFEIANQEYIHKRKQDNANFTFRD